MGARTRTERVPGARAAVAVGGLLAGLLGAVGAGPAAADAASLTQTYQCVFPLLEEEPLTVRISAEIPDEVEVGRSTGRLEITSDATVGADAAEGLRTVGATTLEGVATAGVTIRTPGGELPIRLDNAIGRTAVPEPAEDFGVRAEGWAPALYFHEPGEVRIDVDSLLLTMTPRDAHGDRTSLDTFEAVCTLDPADQDRTLHTLRVTPR
ncbi:DUF6801 domain-containing protein [Streptomyces boncukensis]|uniref:DUF6801 domain-containing protein n=1 Tax=Streptomyces boncukensis TaxID=2711219 RepID=A0A6G4WR95_9ACTN|nr:DUF6801 domain-containing protein [Streptomyces boncukensis]NGO67725.1 hypothetical protein [Streptomyces boncukensis]